MNLFSINCAREPFPPSLSTADANLRENDSLQRLKLTLSAAMKWKDDIESIARSTARKVGSLRFSR